ncbi:MAG: FHIPEP family type III secretion protein [Candidatus Eremiobacteraeota bacterium]|nr:FHIPEP family type III secretion protein [Candidatus Eremiobacteraeota bacterium]
MKEEKSNSRIHRESGDPPPIIIIEVGSLLGYLLKDNNSSSFISEINHLRKTLENEWGMDLPTFLIKENPLINERTYRFLFQEQVLAHSRVHPGKTLIITSREKLAKIPGKIDADPIYSKPCVWIEPTESIVLKTSEPYSASISQLILEHLEMTLRANTRTFITRELVSEQVTLINISEPDTVHAVLSKINLNCLVSIMKNLVPEGIPLTFTNEIMKALAHIEVIERNDPDKMTELLRKIFRDQIHNYIFREKLLLFTYLDEKIQLWLYTNRKKNRLSDKDPVVKKILDGLINLYISFQRKGFRLGILCSAPVRLILRRILEKKLPDVVVLKPGEIDSEREILVVKKIEHNDIKQKLNWYWFWLTAHSEEKKQFRTSLKKLDKLIENRSERYIGKHLEGRAQSESVSAYCRNRVSGKPSENLPAISFYTPMQKIAIFLLGCPSALMQEIFSNLTTQEIAVLGRGMSRLPLESGKMSKKIINDIPGLKDNYPDTDWLINFIHSHFNKSDRDTAPTPLQKLAIIISTLSPRSSDRIYSRILRDMSRNDVENLVTEENDFKVRITSELRSLVVEDFFWFYKGSYQPVVLYSPKEWLSDLQRAVVRSPKKVSIAIKDLWLENIDLLNKFDHFVYKNPAYASFWIRQYILSKKTSPIDLKSVEKAITLIQLLPPELAEQVIRNFDRTWYRIFKNLPRVMYMDSKLSGKVITQFLSHYYSSFDSGLFLKTKDN